METEEQIINDIVDSVYGYDIPTKENNSKKIKLHEEERQKKCGDVLKQINSLCTRIEKELGKTINTSSPQMSTAIRLTVFTAIRAEISNKNEVLDANGKIDVGKFLDIVTKSKDEILGKVKADSDSTLNNSLVGSDLPEETNEKLEPEVALNDKDAQPFWDDLENLGVDISDDDREAINRAIQKVNEFYKKIQEKIDAGMSEEEAWNVTLGEMTFEEREELEAQFLIANVVDKFDRKRNDDREAKSHEGESNGKEVEETLEEQGDTKVEEPLMPGPVTKTTQIPSMTPEPVLPPKPGISSQNQQTITIDRTVVFKANLDITLGMRRIREFQLAQKGYVQPETESKTQREYASFSDTTSMDRTIRAMRTLYENQNIMSVVSEYSDQEEKLDLLRSFKKVTIQTNGKKQVFSDEELKRRGYVFLTQEREGEEGTTLTTLDNFPKTPLNSTKKTASLPIIDEEFDRVFDIKKENLVADMYGINEYTIGEMFSNGPRSSVIRHEDFGTHSEYVAPEEDTPIVTPPTGEPAKVQTPPIVAEDVIVGTFEPKPTPPTAESTAKTVKENDDATSKSEGNIPLSGVKTFLGEVATVRNAAEATEKLHINGERGVSKEGTNNPQGTPTVEDEPKTGEVPEEPQ